MTTNMAAWLMAEKSEPFKIDTAPFPDAGENQLVIRNRAVAINPFDGILQREPTFPLQYPTILGQDVAGVVEAVGPNVTRFKKGDRVVGHAAGFGNRSDAEKAFQHFTRLQTNLACEIPDGISFERAAVLPICLSTAATGLFQEDFLNLQRPTAPRRAPTGQTVLVWGGASSVGSNAIQLAVAAGYDVITTASPKNFAYVTALGARQVFDYHAPTVVDDLVKALEGKTIAGAYDCITGPSWTQCFEVLRRSEGIRFLATTRPGWPEPPAGVQAKFVFGLSLKDNSLGREIYEGFLPGALASKAFVPAPEPFVAGHGLESIQQAVHLQAKGVSARKIVVTL